MKIFHGDTALADMYLNRVQEHYDADEIIQGTYWENGKGCAVGCTIHSSNHKDYEKLIGLSEAVARLQDRIFENLPDSAAKEFPLQFIKACHKSTGKVSDNIAKKFLLWLLTEELAPIYDKQSVAYKSAIKQCVQAISDQGNADAAAAYAASYASFGALAASYAARAASYAALAASYAARAAAYDADAASYAARAVSYTARADAVSYAARDAGASFWIRMANKLISIIEELK